MASKNFTWIFPPPSNPSSSSTFIATNATQGFGSSTYHVKDVVELQFDAEINGNDRFEIDYLCDINFNSNDNRTLSLARSFVPENDDPLNVTLGLAGSTNQVAATEKTCAFSYYNTTQNIIYTSVAFRVYSISKETPLLYTLNEPDGTVYQPKVLAESVATKGRGNWKMAVGSAVMVIVGLCIGL